ncbi:hypothetical protein HL658_12035 [Azospirillum sp. RWY-5-1]|uniref:Uncharacterized protein n=1 Tax=Azospirillum oleiclasticum TaxID=2735135 RepID=A0ABX2T7Y9_9PROT|nr:hypothetical protein [Azospirillum oleiclasticum]NYZ13283.1 hypothetical protein [Azospirillum oleiclasticum]NYZ20444.1 hypothetical protein [Azospirillum oleiclasticum]
MTDDEDTLPLAERLDRDGWPSEMLGPVPRPGGPVCARVLAGLGRWRREVDQRADIQAARAWEEGRGEEVAAALARVEREIAAWERLPSPSAADRLIALRARRVYLLSLRDRQPPRP